MKFASPEIREKAVRAYLDGKATAKQLAGILGYSPATICNWVRAYRETQQLSAKPRGYLIFKIANFETISGQFR